MWNPKLNNFYVGEDSNYSKHIGDDCPDNWQTSLVGGLASHKHPAFLGEYYDPLCRMLWLGQRRSPSHIHYSQLHLKSYPACLRETYRASASTGTHVECEKLF